MKTSSGTKIIGWGKYAPARILTNDELSRMVDTTDEWIVQRTGIRERRIAAEGETTASMAIAAGAAALQAARLNPGDIDLIIVATSSPDHLTPPVSSQIQHGLNCMSAGAFTLVLGCTGFVAAYITADLYLRAGLYRNVLVIGAELMSRSIDWTSRDTCVLFGDAAGAVVLAKGVDESTGVCASHLGSDGSGADLLIVPAGGVKIPSSHESVSAGEHHLRMDGAEVFKFASQVVGNTLKLLLQKAALSVDELSLLIPHQANLRIIQAACRQAGLPQDKVFVNLDRYGNTSAASVPVAMCEAQEAGRIRAGDLIALVAFGAGLSWGGVLIRV